MLKLTMAYPMDKEITLTEDLDQLLSDQERELSGEIENNLELELLKKQKVLSEYDLKNIRMTNYPQLVRSEEHTSELQSRPHLVCRLLLEKKNSKNTDI